MSSISHTATKLYALSLLASEDPFILTMGGEQLKDNAAHYKNQALGCDAWSPKEVAQLPSCAASLLAEAMVDSLNAPSSPHQSLLNLNPTLGKMSGGHRTSRHSALQSAVREWELSHSLPEGSAKKGGSALNAALYRSARAEIHGSLGQCVGSLFLILRNSLTRLTPLFLWTRWCCTIFL